EGIRREETVALEGVVGAQGDGLADPLTEKLAGEKPAKVGRVTAFGEVDAQLLGVEAAARKQAEKLLVHAPNVVIRPARRDGRARARRLGAVSRARGERPAGCLAARPSDGRAEELVERDLQRIGDLGQGAQGGVRLARLDGEVLLCAQAGATGHFRGIPAKLEPALAQALAEAAR